MAVLPVPVLFRLPVGTPSDKFAGSSLFRLPVGSPASSIRPYLGTGAEAGPEQEENWGYWEPVTEGWPTRSCCDHRDPYLPSADFWTCTSPVQATGRVSSQPVMRVTSTSSAQTAGCGHTEVQQGLPVTEVYRLQRIISYREICYSHHYWQGEGSYSWTGPVMSAGLPVTENYRLQRNLLFPPLLARRQLQWTSPVRMADLPVTEYCRLENYRLQRNLLFASLLARNQLQIQCRQPVTEVFPVTENWWWQVSWTGRFFRKIKPTGYRAYRPGASLHNLQWQLLHKKQRYWWSNQTEPGTPGYWTGRSTKELTNGTDLSFPNSLVTENFGYREAPSYQFDRLQRVYAELWSYQELVTEHCFTYNCLGSGTGQVSRTD